jgi:hypothetical protein
MHVSTGHDHLALDLAHAFKLYIVLTCLEFVQEGMQEDVERASRPNNCFHRQVHVLRRKDAFRRNLLRQAFQLFDTFLQRLEAVIHVARMKC